MNATLWELTRQIVFRMLGASPVLALRLYRVARAGSLTVLNFHRVDDAAESAHEAMAPTLFNDLVGWLKQQFHIVTFRDLDGCLPAGKPPIILSFDDGYADFIRVVMPILSRQRVAANLNIVPEVVETGRPPRNVLLRDFIRQAPDSLLRETPLPGLGIGAPTSDRFRMGMAVSAALKARPIAEQARVMAELAPWLARLDTFRPTPVMTADEVAQSAETHEIGAHSFAHATMTAESDDYLIKDLDHCTTWFERHLKLRPRVYAFPNGAARPAQTQTVLAHGYMHVLLVGEDFSHPEARVHPRFAMHGRSRVELKVRALGGCARPVPQNPFPNCSNVPS